MGGETVKLSAWQRIASPYVTRAARHLFADRQKLAETVQGIAQVLDGPRAKALRLLLNRSGLVYEKFGNIAAADLQACHYSPTLREEAIRQFCRRFNLAFGRIVGLTYHAGNFEVSILPLPQPEPSTATAAAGGLQVMAETGLPSRIVISLQQADHPPTLFEISRDLGSDEGSVGLAIGQLLGAGTVAATIETEELKPRFYLPDPDWPGRATLATYESDAGACRSVYVREAERLLMKGKESGAFRVILPDGNLHYVSAGRFEADDYIKLDGDRPPTYANKTLINVLLENGRVLQGYEDDLATTCYFLPADQRRQGEKLLNGLARAYFDKWQPQATAEEKMMVHQKLKAAFEAGIKYARPASVTDYLAAAETYIGLNGDLTGLIILLVSHRSCLAQMRLTGVFQLEEIRQIEQSYRRLTFARKLPAILTEGFSHALQNFFYLIFDLTDNYPVFVALLARKASDLKLLVDQGQSVSEAVEEESELVYAPLAEQYEFIDLANQIRNNCFKSNDPKKYEETRRRMEEHLGLPLETAKRHTHHLAEMFRAAANSSIPGRPVLYSRDRLKEVAALANKTVADQTDQMEPDIMGIRLVCRTLDEAYKITSWLQTNYELAKLEELPKDKIQPEDRLVKGRATGWKAWRGYFVDPTSVPVLGEKHREKRRLISVQVQLASEEKASGRGRAAHWKYKLMRVIRLIAHRFSIEFKKQHFDPPPTGKYNGQPEHDYYVDREMARAYKSVLAAKNQRFKKQRFNSNDASKVVLLRISGSDTVEAIVSFRSYDDFLINGYNHSKLFELKLDEESEELVLKPYAAGKAAFGASIPGPQADGPSLPLLVAQSGPGLGQKLGDLRTASNLRTRFLVTLAAHRLSAEAGPDLVAVGKDAAYAHRLNKVSDMKAVLSLSGLKDANEVWEAIALGIIDQSYVDLALESIKPKVEIKFSDKVDGGYELTIACLDHTGICQLVQEKLMNFDILSVQSTNLQIQGLSFASSIITVKPKDDSARIGGLNYLLKHALTDLLAIEETPKEDMVTAQLSITSSTNWNALHQLAEICAIQGANLVSTDLPMIDPAQGQQTGKVIFEFEKAESDWEEFFISEMGQAIGRKVQGLSFELRLIG